MTIDNKDIAPLIIDFLKSAVKNKSVSEDYAESMDVAIDCIADAFEVDKDDLSVIKDKFSNKSLKEIIENGGVSESKESSAAPVDEATKAKADELKLLGNRAMAAKNFTEAIEKYGEAIELDPTNVVYLSNRAAAHSSASEHAKAVADAEKAIKLDPNFSKSYSRLGLARYALGDAKGAMDAYKKGLDVEGDKKSDAMRRGYETAKGRVEEDLEKSMPKSDVATQEGEQNNEGSSRGAGGNPGAGAGGMPDLSSMFGGGGMPDLSSMMNNPQIMQAAQQMMSNPDAMLGLMNNPMLRQMAESFGMGGGQGGQSGQNDQGGQGGQGGGPDLSELMNNPMLRNMANQFMGGGNNNNNNNNNNSQ